MNDVKVYLYEYFDGLLKRERRSTDYALAETIAGQRGTIIAESERVVDQDLVGHDGHILAANIPLPEEEGEAVEPPPRKGGRGLNLGR